MNKKIFPLFLIFCILIMSTIFSGCITSKQSLRFDGRTRTYLIHVPPQYDDSKSFPLVIALHGGGGNSQNMMEKTGFNNVSDEKGFIVVYPDGVGRFKNRLLTWNAGHCCGYALDNNIDDVGFIRALIEKIQNNFNIDSKRIYVTGHSNGGMMTYRLGAELSDIIAAIAPVAGTIGGRENENSTLIIIPEPIHPVSVIALHGLLDESVPYNGGHGNNTRNDRIDLSVNESISFWVEHNECNINPDRNVSDSGNIVIDYYLNGENKSDVAIVTVMNGGHAWFGSDKDLTENQEINATEVIWEFFESHPKVEEYQFN
jgi:polyhydroxybutyrate depolymerase